MFVSLTIGGHETGQSWIAGAPFMDSVRDMAPYWVWRSVGGTFMAISHVVFAWNLWYMRPGAFVNLMQQPDTPEPEAPSDAAAAKA